MVEGHQRPTGPAGQGGLTANNSTATTYSGSSYYANYGNSGSHLSVTFQPSSSGSRVMVGATFQLRRGGNQNNNWYANASIGGGGSLQSVKGVSTNSHSS